MGRETRIAITSRNQNPEDRGSGGDDRGVRAARVDRNQREIVEALRKAGCSVRSLAACGNGIPDLLVGLAGKNFLMEVKDGDKAPSRRALTPAQKKFFRDWRGQIARVETVHDALDAVINFKNECKSYPQSST